MDIKALDDAIVDPNGFELGIKERIIIHLYRYRHLRDEYTVPDDITAEGISQSHWNYASILCQGHKGTYR